jgi:hypothetical protein
LIKEAAMNIGFVAAAVLSLITFGVHTFVGGKYAARPLLAATDFDRASRWLNYFTWHMATVLLLVMAAGFGWAAASYEAWPAAAILTIMAALFSPLCVWVAMKGRIAPWRFPASWLFVLIVLAALWGSLDVMFYGFRQVYGT